MKRKITIVFLVILAAAAFTPTILGPSTVLANGGYDINWWTVDSGGGLSQSAGGEYTLKGTIGQADAGSSSGGEYALEGGFWAGIREWVTQFFILLPLVLR